MSKRRELEPWLLARRLEIGRELRVDGAFSSALVEPVAQGRGARDDLVRVARFAKQILSMEDALLFGRTAANQARELLK